MLDMKQGYLTMFYMLDDHYWEKTKNDSLGGMLSDLSPHIFVGCISADPAAWDDWINSVKKITEAELLTDKEALQASIVFLEFYMTEFGFEIGWIVDDIKSMSSDNEMWLSSIKKSIEASELY